jgi:geranylgeranyl reductase family protein
VSAAPKDHQADVIVVGGGPAGSVLAWALARKGVHTLLIERSRFPREKVCGDYVDPRGLRVLEAMGCLEQLDRYQSPPIARTVTFVEDERLYSGPIPFYGPGGDLPPHGYTIPRERLDAAMLEAAARAGAIVHEQTAVSGIDAQASGVEVTGRRGQRRASYTARLLAGADGANSLVARRLGLMQADARFTVVAQRCYAIVEQADHEAETEVFFNEDSFPGYGWLFPGVGGLVNIGVGLLAEARERSDVHMPSLFSAFLERLRRHHPRCGSIELASKPIGGIVRTYGGAGRNHCDGGLLVGDAGGFADPMTGEGITQGMESALLAAPVLLAALEAGEFGADRLAPYEVAFRAYFDPAMVFLDFCAAVMRNRHFARPWLSVMARGCAVAQEDEQFARTCSSWFGGLQVRPLAILGRVWAGMMQETLSAWPALLSRSSTADAAMAAASPADPLEWQAALARSMLSDPLWHLRWTLDVERRWATVLRMVGSGARDRRVEGLLPD